MLERSGSGVSIWGAKWKWEGGLRREPWWHISPGGHGKPSRVGGAGYLEEKRVVSKKFTLQPEDGEKEEGKTKTKTVRLASGLDLAT